MIRVKRVFLGRGYWGSKNFHIRSINANLSRENENNIEFQLDFTKHEAIMESRLYQNDFSIIYSKFNEDDELEERRIIKSGHYRGYTDLKKISNILYKCARELAEKVAKKNLPY